MSDEQKKSCYTYGSFNKKQHGEVSCFVLGSPFLTGGAKLPCMAKE